MERIDPDTVVESKGGAPRKYPWDRWMDGSMWRLREGIDYKISTRSFRATVYRQAKRLGCTARVVRLGDGVAIQLTPKEDSNA